MIIERVVVPLLKVHRGATREAARGMVERGEPEIADAWGRHYSRVDSLIESLEPTPLYCKKCGDETNEVHLWLCRGCFDEMGMAVEFDPEWTPEDL